MRNLALFLVAAMALTSGAAAASDPAEPSSVDRPAVQSAGDVGPLPPGKPAGVAKAQAVTATAVLYGLSIGLTGLGIALIASGGKAHHGTTTTTTATGTH